MSSNLPRRRFLTAASTTAALGQLVDLNFLGRLPSVSADEASGVNNAVHLAASIEPLVRLIEETPCDELLESIAGEIHSGASYREIVAGLMLAGVRNVKPRPDVGFKFHSVLVVNSALLASLSGPDEHRWLPIFWALDYFKEAQADQRRKESWVMQSIDDSKLPAAPEASKAFCAAMDNWDEQAADAATAALARTSGLQQTYELFYRYAARDYRSIGHKAIFVANSRRTLDCIGAEHAEPVLRSLAFAMLAHEGENPATRDAAADHAWRANVPRASQLRNDWLVGKVDRSVTAELLKMMRTVSPDEASTAVVEIINRGNSPQVVWDAVFLAAAELLMRQPAIVPLHAVTTSNALNYLWRSSADDQTRRMLLLQAAAFIPHFRESSTGRGRLAAWKIDEMEPARLTSTGFRAISEALGELSNDPYSAAGKILAWLDANKQPQEFIDAARVLVFLKGNDAHDYKFSTAVLEDWQHISPAWRDRYLAASVFKLCGSSDRDNPLVKRTRAALKAPA